MDFTLIITAVAALAGAVLGSKLVAFSYDIAARQPVDVDLDAELVVLAAAARDRAWGRQAVVTLDMFADDTHRAAWVALSVSDPDVALPDALAALDAGADAAAAVELLLAPHDTASRNPAPSDPDTVARAVQDLVELHENRTIYAARSLSILNADGVWVRHVPAPPRGRTFAVPLIGATVATLGVPLLATYGDASATLTAAFAYALLVGLAIVVALVDHDTMRVDFTLMAIFGIPAWVFAISAALLSERGITALHGGGAVVGVVTLLWVSGAVWQRIFGQEGVGGGDLVAALVLVGVPVILAGTGALAVWGLLATCVSMLVRVVTQVLTGTPYAVARVVPMVPHMAIGSLVGWVIVGPIPALLA